MPDSREERYRNRYDGGIAGTEEAGRKLTRNFTDGATNFDPRKGFDEYVTGAHNRFRREFKQDVGDLRGQQVGMGRLDTGFATGDENRLFESSAARMQEGIASRAVQVQGQELDRLNMVGSMGSAYDERALAAVGGEYQTIRQQRLQDEANKRRGWGNVISATLGAAGTVLAGPIGGALVNKVSENVMKKGNG